MKCTNPICLFKGVMMKAANDSRYREDRVVSFDCEVIRQAQWVRTPSNGQRFAYGFIRGLSVVTLLLACYAIGARL